MAWSISHTQQLKAGSRPSRRPLTAGSIRGKEKNIEEEE